MSRLHVYPAPGRTVRDPMSFEVVPPRGREVPQTDYWLRRIADGDLIEGKPPEAEAEPEPTRAKRRSD